MPYKLSKSGKGYKVKSPHRMMSKKPMSKEMAMKQMAAIHMNAPEYEGMSAPAYRGKGKKRKGKR